MCMQRNGYSFMVVFRWTRFLLIGLVKTATDFESLVPRRKGMDFKWSVTTRVGERLWKALYDIEDGNHSAYIVSRLTPVLTLHPITICCAGSSFDYHDTIATILRCAEDVKRVFMVFKMTRSSWVWRNLTFRRHEFRKQLPSSTRSGSGESGRCATSLLYMRKPARKLTSDK
jgi:hypothetical protein